jgi:hypothetical protein
MKELCNFKDYLHNNNIELFVDVVSERQSKSECIKHLFEMIIKHNDKVVYREKHESILSKLEMLKIIKNYLREYKLNKLFN